MICEAHFVPFSGCVNHVVCEMEGYTSIMVLTKFQSDRPRLLWTATSEFGRLTFLRTAMDDGLEKWFCLLKQVIMIL